jgi:hypothetical protein
MDEEIAVQSHEPGGEEGAREEHLSVGARSLCGLGVGTRAIARVIQRPQGNFAGLAVDAQQSRSVRRVGKRSIEGDRTRFGLREDRIDHERAKR